MSQPFVLAAGPRYEGPHGPATVPPDQAPDATRVGLPDGEARLAWGMASTDRSQLERGVQARIGARELVLRLRDRRLELLDGSEAVVAVARRRRGSIVIEQPGGEEVASFKPTRLAGEVAEAATSEDVAFMLLLLVSNAGSALERRVPLPFFP
jgi:hypothetical protein